jgi:hypothetical protein
MVMRNYTALAIAYTRGERILTPAGMSKGEAGTSWFGGTSRAYMPTGCVPDMIEVS